MFVGVVYRDGKDPRGVIGMFGWREGHGFDSAWKVAQTSHGGLVFRHPLRMEIGQGWKLGFLHSTIFLLSGTTGTDRVDDDVGSFSQFYHAGS